jgi:hypothetical protein
MSFDRPCSIGRVFASALIVFVACRCYANAYADDYKRGMKVLEEARQQREFERRNELLDEAQSVFRTFLKENPEHSLAYSARSQIGNILVERARLQMVRARNTNGTTQIEARRLYQQACENFETLEAELKAVLTKLVVPPPPDPTDREKLAIRDRLRADYLQSQLLSAAVLEESADTYDSRDAKRQEILAKAGSEYQEIHNKYRTFLAGTYACFYQGRCLWKRGRCDEALQFLGQVLDLPDQPRFSAPKTKALSLALECWLDDSQKEYRQATVRGDEWLKKHRGRSQESHDWLGLRLHLARAHWLLAESLDDIQERITHREKAKALAEFVRRQEGTYQAEARKLLDEIGDDDAAAGPREPKAEPLRKLVEESDDEG